jgi:exopolysaccharide biosynthesis polyprenyl glycosylphosphotransferase
LRSVFLVALAGLLHFGGLLAWRSLEEQPRSPGLPAFDARNVLIVGAGRVGQEIALYLRNHPEQRRVVCGFLDDEMPLGNGVIGRVNNLARLARAGFADEVILAAPHNQELTRRVVESARQLRLDVEIVPDLFGCQPAAEEVEHLGALPLICLHEEQLPAPTLLLKRVLDIVGASLVLVTLSPLFALIAALIKLDSRGPVIYAAPRAGRKGRPFRCCKFRTMVHNAEDLKDELRARNERTGPFFKITGDPRITRVGRFLRRYSLDELPQLWNVLRGEMSLVGPRPHPLDDFAGYEIGHLGRLDVPPGITGLWQVTARRDPSFHRSIELDRQYIRNWSLGMDLRILLKTLGAVVGGSGE